jgi:hypothetical protein
MPTFFARHTWKMDIDEPTRRRIWDERRIAIHYPHAKDGQSERDSESSNPDDYQGPGRVAMKALVELARLGGYVCAQYQGREASLVGVVEPGSPIELLSGRWGSLHGYKDRTAVLKTLRLVRVKEVRPCESAAILVGRPRQGTLLRWPSAGKAIENLVEGRAGEVELADLLDAQQETLCSEFLRLPQARQFGLPNLVHLLLPVGRTMKDIDIYGLADDGKRIFAQVTFLPLDQARWKIDRLLPYKDADRYHLILFCQAERPAVVDGVSVVPIQEAFAQFRASPTGRQWLAHLS